MYIKNGLYTSEFVTKGHPDKVADQISDAILTECLKQDENSRVAVECLIGGNELAIMGEITTKAKVNYAEVAKAAIRRAGYTDKASGFDVENAKIRVNISTQSPDIALGVDRGGAGDQGMMYGYACTETIDLMPAGYMIARKLCFRLEELRENGKINWLRPDGKAQVTIEYRDGRPYCIDTVLVSTQHDETVDHATIKEVITKMVIDYVLETYGYCYMKTKSVRRILVNPTGRFEIGGPIGDTGLTGRKIIVDTYGGYAHHGGGAFSGKDPTKVDRSGAYAARHIAKCIVACRLASRCEVQLAYAIGEKQPVSININCFGTNEEYSEDKIERAVRKVFDLEPLRIIERYNLRYFDYNEVSSGGHFAKLCLPWESLGSCDYLIRTLRGE